MLHIEICRICLRTDVKLYKYDRYYLKQYYEEVMSARMNINDGLSQHFCYECAFMLHKFHKFREKCYTGQKTLTELLWNGPITITSLAKVDRESKHFKSPLGIIKMNKKIKTCYIKSKTLQCQSTVPENNHYVTEKLPEIEDITLPIIEPLSMDCDSDDSLDNKNLAQYKNAIAIKENYRNDNIIDDSNLTIDKKELANEMSIDNIDDGNIYDDKSNSDKFTEEVINETIENNKKNIGKKSKKQINPKNSNPMIGEEKLSNEISVDNIDGSRILRSLLINSDDDELNSDVFTEEVIVETIENKNKYIGKKQINQKNSNLMMDKEKLTNEIGINNIDDSRINSDDDGLNSDIFTEEVIKDTIENKSKGNKRKKKMNHDNTLKKFEIKPKKYLLDPEHWLKIHLSEEEALEEFKARAQDPKYMAANHKCTECYKAFSQEDMLIRHKKLRHSETIGTIVCRFCSMRFKWNHALKQHITEHYTKYKCLRCDLICVRESTAIFHNDYHNGVMRKCMHCDQEFRHMSTYYTHLRTHRSEHVCTLCGASFVSAIGLRKHKRTIHVDTNFNPAEGVNTHCVQCDIKFETRDAYDEHVFHSAKHAECFEDSGSEVPKLPKKDPNRLIRDRPQKPNTNLQEAVNKSCVRCDVNFETRQAFEEHVLQHGGIKDLGNEAPTKPPNVTKRTRKGQWGRHIVTTCSICDKVFRSYRAYTKHHTAEHSDVPIPKQRYICEICGASLTPGNITVHANIHSRKRLYACDTCGREFSTKGAMTRHQLTHTGEKPVPCKLCDKRFTQKASMMLHYRTFHLKQPYPKSRCTTALIVRRATMPQCAVKKCKKQNKDGVSYFQIRKKKFDYIPKLSDSMAHSGPDSDDDMPLDKYRF